MALAYPLREANGARPLRSLAASCVARVFKIARFLSDSPIYRQAYVVSSVVFIPHPILRVVSETSSAWQTCFPRFKEAFFI
jgi:hypothetical protein